MAVEKALRVKINFYKNQCISVIRWKKNHPSKQAVSIIYTLEKKAFAAATLEGL